LVFGRIPLETCRKHFLLFLSSAKAITEAELAIAVVACLFRGAGFQFKSGRFLGSCWRIERYDGAVAKAGAFAK
jgi:hypothetical protein